MLRTVVDHPDAESRHDWSLIDLDHRASLKIEFSMYGLTEKADFWINWSSDSDHPPIDNRVLEWLTETYEKFRAKWDEETGEAARKRAAEAERFEREELARLKAKYESQSRTGAEP